MKLILEFKKKSRVKEKKMIKKGNKKSKSSHKSREFFTH